jgi:predicted nucleic acid-binding Zn ribbon protein
MATSKGEKNRPPKPRTEQSRTERVNAMRAEEQKRERRQTLIIAGVGVALVAVIAGLVVFFYANRPKPPDYSKVPDTAPSGVNDTYNANAKDANGKPDRWGGISHNHVEGTISYPLSPPDGGDHNQYPQTCGVYSKAIANENAVHSLEHGAVWIAYKPGISSGQLETIKADVKNLSYTLVSPYPGLSDPVVASAWGVQLKLKSADDPRLQQFIRYYRLNPDRTPEVGVACSGVS